MGDCPVKSTYLGVVLAQRNSLVKLDVEAAG
jgi:hypothetical protein